MAICGGTALLFLINKWFIKYKLTTGIKDFGFVNKITNKENVSAFLDSQQFSPDPLLSSVFFKYMFQLYQGVGQRPY